MAAGVLSALEQPVEQRARFRIVLYRAGGCPVDLNAWHALAPERTGKFLDSDGDDLGPIQQGGHAWRRIPGISDLRGHFLLPSMMRTAFRTVAVLEYATTAPISRSVRTCSSNRCGSRSVPHTVASIAR